MKKHGTISIGTEADVDPEFQELVEDVLKQISKSCVVDYNLI